MRGLAFLLLLFASYLQAHSIVFVHLGHSTPSYLPIAIAQARLFNKNCEIYLIASQSALAQLSSTLTTHQVSPVPCESLDFSEAHHYFNAHSSHDRKSIQGFWFYTSERFFYLEEFIRGRHLTDVFHLENDVMIYVDLNELLPTFKKHYTNCIGATFEHDGRCVPGFLYIPNEKPLEPLVQFMAKRANLGEQEMFVIGLFDQAHHQTLIDSLPVIPPQYAQDHALATRIQRAKAPAQYFNHFEAFDSIFDAAAIGQFLGGMNPQYHADAGPGFVSPIAMYNVSYFSFSWEKDSAGRLIPYSTYRGEKKRINNLHVHCKDLKSFYSLREN